MNKTKSAHRTRLKTYSATSTLRNNSVAFKYFCLKCALLNQIYVKILISRNWKGFNSYRLQNLNGKIVNFSADFYFKDQFHEYFLIGSFK